MTHQQPQAPASGAPPARPALVREHSSNSGSSHFEGLLTGAPMDGFSVPENEVTNGQRPASHPSMTARSPPGGTSEPDYSLRPRPQTMPPGQTPSLQPEASRSPPKTDFPEYRYQDYISTTSSEAQYDGHQKGPTDVAQIFSSTSSHANDRSNGASSEDANPQPRRFSSEQSMTDDVRYDSRRITADMDTYDIISA